MRHGARIDARLYHNPEKAPELVEQAIRVAGSQREVAERCGVTREYLRRLVKGQGKMSYGVQVMLEAIAGGVLEPPGHIEEFPKKG